MAVDPEVMPPPRNGATFGGRVRDGIGNAADAIERGSNSYLNNVAAGMSEVPLAAAKGVTRTVRTKGAWGIGIYIGVVGTTMFVGTVWNMVLGFASGMVNDRALQNAPVEMRFGHGAARMVKYTAGGVLGGVDQGVRVQLADYQQPTTPQQPIQIRTDGNAPYPVIPIYYQGGSPQR